MLFNYTSQFGEDGLIEEAFKLIGIKNKWCVEFGAADGLLFSNTRLLIEQGWSSVQIEADEERFNRLQNLYFENELVTTLNEKVGLNTTNNLDFLLSSTKCPKDLDLMVIDVDGQEFHIWNGLLNYRPRVLVIEYDPSVENDFIPIPNGDGQAGYKGLVWVAAAKEYDFFNKTKTNLIFIAREDFKKSLSEIQNER